MSLKQADQNGFALILVLTLAALIAGLAANMLLSLRNGAEAAHAFEGLIKKRIAVDSAIEIGVARLRDPAAEPFLEMTFRIDELDVSLQVSAETDRIDLNGASIEELEAWIDTALDNDDPDLALMLAHRIVDWRDEDDLRQLEGAEAADYERAGLDYVPADAPFRHVNELREILGMTQAVFAKLRGQAAIATGQSASTDSLAEQIDAEDEDAEQQGSEATAEAREDSANTYRLSITVRGEQLGQLRTDAVVWVEPAAGERDYELLDYEPFLIERADE